MGGPASKVRPTRSGVPYARRRPSGNGRDGRLVEPAPEDADHLADIGYVVGIRPLVEVARELPDRLAVPAHPAEQEATITAMLRIRWLEDEEEIDRIEGGR